MGVAEAGTLSCRQDRSASLVGLEVEPVERDQVPGGEVAQPVGSGEKREPMMVTPIDAVAEQQTPGA